MMSRLCIYRVMGIFMCPVQSILPAMKIAAVLCTLVISSLTEELAPYAPSGWKPDGPAFVLPSFETNEQFNQTRQLPNQAYGIPHDSSATPMNGLDAVTQNSQGNSGNFQFQRQLSYKEYIEQQNNNDRGIQQQLPKQYVSQHFQNSPGINQYDRLRYQQQLGNLNNYQQLPGTSRHEFRPENQMINNYLPSFDPQIDVRSRGQNSATTNTQRNQNQITPSPGYIPSNQPASFMPNLHHNQNSATTNMQRNQNQITPNPGYISSNQPASFMPNLHPSGLRQSGGNQKISPSIDIQPKTNSDVLAQHQSILLNSNFGLRNPNKQYFGNQNTQQLEESRERKQIPDQYLPVYDPNITHIEEKGRTNFKTQTQHSPSFRNQNNGKRLNFEKVATDKGAQTTYNYDGVYRTIVLNEEDEVDTDGAFGRRLSTTRSPTKERRAKKPELSLSNKKYQPDVETISGQPNIAVSTAIANGRYFRRQNDAIL